MVPEVRSLLRRVNDEVALMPDPVLRSFGPVLVQAQRELERNLTHVLSTLPAPGELAYSERFTTQQLRNALTQMQGAVRAVSHAQQHLGVQMVKTTDVVSRAASRHLHEELVKFSARFEDSISPIPIVQAARISHELLADQYRQSAAKWGVSVAKDVRLQLSLGLARHETVEQLAKRLLGVGNVRLYGAATPAKQAKVISERLYRKYEYEARRLARTEVIHAYNAVKGDLIEQLHADDPDIMQRWDAAIDRRTCPLCRDLDHVAVPVRKVFPGGYTAPPAHPFCRCVLVVWKRTWREAGDVRVEKGYPLSTARHGRGGPVRVQRPLKSLRNPTVKQPTPPTPPLGAELKKHEMSIVDRDTEKALVLDARGGVLLQKEGEVSGVDLQEHELGLLKNNVLTHNHPGGTSLSAGDGYFAARTDMSEIRAVLRNEENEVEVHSLSRPAGGWPSQSKLRNAYENANVAAHEKIRELEDAGRTFTKKQARQFIQRESWEGASKELGIKFSVRTHRA